MTSPASPREIRRTWPPCTGRTLQPNRADRRSPAQRRRGAGDGAPHDPNQMKSGDIAYAKVGSSTLILVESLRSFIHGRSGSW